MRSVLTFAGMAIVVAVVTPKLIEHIGAQRSTETPVAMTAAAPITHSSRSVVINADAQGHFRVEARVDGRRLDFMLDTGASLIALTVTDAARIGIRPARGDYTARVRTANGTVKAAQVQIGTIEIDGIRVNDVPALVLPDEALSENLLGLSFLSRLRRFEYARGKLVLEQ
jgi:aspartyl protease family protein